MASCIARLSLALILLEIVAVLDAATTRSSTVAPLQLSSDCSTVIVTNASRLPKSSSSQKASTTGCNARRHGRKLPPIVGNLFREEVESYPEDEIRLILQRTPDDLKDLYNVINTQLDPNTNLTERVASRHNDDEDYSGEREESVCRTVTRNIYPREANLRNSLVYIPNNHDFMQVIQAEICHSPDAECNYLKDNLPYGMVSSCEQKYSYKKLLYMDPLDKRLSSDLFRYPSCCVCKVRSLPLDLRSNTANQSGTISRLPASAIQSDSKTAAPTATTMMTFTQSQANIGNSSPISDPNSAAGASHAAPQQPSEASIDSQLSTRNINRASKQLRSPSNQTLILVNDKVYNPKK